MSNNASSRTTQSSPVGSDKDKEFEPTIDMMVNDFDDEGTLDEAEATETAEEQRDEAQMLQQEQDMPIEKLLAMYGQYPAGGGASGGSGGGDAPPAGAAEQDKDDAENDKDEEDDEEEASRSSSASGGRGGEKDGSSSPPEPRDAAETGGDGDGPPAKKRRRSALSALYPELEAAGKRALRSEAPADEASGASGGGGGGEEAADDSDGSADSSGDDSSWRKTIMIGSVYQAQIPDGLQRYGDTPPYENEDKLLWEPWPLSAAAVEAYLRSVQQWRLQQAGGVAAVPNGAHVRDAEQALYMLQQCGHNVEEAMRRIQMTSHQPIDTLSLWSEEECANFENGLGFYGKDFYTIQQQKVRTRSVGELVQFYYLWKKTERHDVFANKNKMEKRKYALNPGVTDYMDRFLEEQDRDPSSASGRVDADAGPSLQLLMSTTTTTAADASAAKRWPSGLAVPFSAAAAIPLLVGSGAGAGKSVLQQ